ncbi:hypothetical protein [Bacillus sp. BPN334]|uniref:hypothetical protein n=1 Tax=Bacillus sp. BPN334 TaxID=2217815 RepID=UPI002104735A|nr:hypothetical protein [Bacillus sp. BPN334]
MKNEEFSTYNHENNFEYRRVRLAAVQEFQGDYLKVAEYIKENGSLHDYLTYLLDATQELLVSESAYKSPWELEKYEFTADELELLFSGFYFAVRLLPENIGHGNCEAIRYKSEDFAMKCLKEAIKRAEKKKEELK